MKIFVLHFLENCYRIINNTEKQTSPQCDSSSGGPKREADVAVMTEVDCAANLVDFVNSGRTGRRNAVPDIENDKYCKVGTGSLTFDLEKLQCSDAPGRSDKEVSGGFGGAKEGASSGNSQGT